MFHVGKIMILSFKPFFFPRVSYGVHCSQMSEAFFVLFSVILFNIKETWVCVYKKVS